MQRCLELAQLAEGRTAPNPMVGALVLDADGDVVGSGYHHAAGQPHAEIHALDEAGDRARGGTIYVSLEPCCHFGRTPPCVDKVIASGVRRVIAAVGDPNPVVSGKGFAALRERGIEVVENVMLKEASWLNRGFFKVKRTGRPWVILKLATTLDGKIADRFNSSKWITGEESRQLVHDLRNRLDCVLVGAGTARFDDPSLNVRGIENKRDPKRAVIDPSLSISPQSKLCRLDTGGDTILFCAPDVKESRSSEYPEHVKLIDVSEKEPGSQRGQRHHLDLEKCLEHLAVQNVLTVLCEGGGKLAGSLLQSGLVDEIYWFYAPKILGDTEAVPAIAHEQPLSINSAAQFDLLEARVLGNDTLIHCTTRSWF